jgi:hypothetical protein
MLLADVRTLFLAGKREFNRGKRSPIKSERLAYFASAAEYTELGIGLAHQSVRAYYSPKVYGPKTEQQTVQDEAERLRIVRTLSKLASLSIAAGLACCDLSQ